MKSAANSIWRWCLNSVTGPSHESEERGCEDVCGIGVTDQSSGLLLMAISDGAGSAAFAREGAEIVVDSWMKHFSSLLSSSQDPTRAVQHLSRSSVEALLQVIRRKVDRRAVELGCEVSDFSATLLGAVVHPEASFIAQVGDGCWVGEVDGVVGCLTWPVQGEFASQTHFAISDSAPAVLQCAQVPAGLSALAGFTDGVERLALHFASKIPEKEFFRPLFDAVHVHEQMAEPGIRAFLNSERIRTLSDDDKTLVILVRNDRGLR